MVEVNFVPPGAVDMTRLDAALRAQFGSAISGATKDSQGVRVNFDGSPSLANQAAAESIVLGHGSIALTVDQGSIDADGVDSAVVSWSGEDGVDSFDVTVYLGGEVFNSDTDSAAPFQLTFSTDVAGSYVVMVQKVGTNETGFISVEAV